jgi:methionine synthase II (cobalamin-independent)
MFATLAGGLPRPPADLVPAAAGKSERVAAAIGLQVELGLEPLTDGHPGGEPVATTALGLDGVARGPGGSPALVERSARWSRPIHVDGWRRAAALTDRVLKQAVGGPYTIGRSLAGDGVGRRSVTLDLAEALNAELRALADAGCPLIQVDEPGAVAIGDSPAEAGLFREAQRRLLDGVEGTHLSLAVTGGNAEAPGAGTFFEAPYASYLFDLIDGPDNWRLIARAPGDRGIVCGAVPGGDQPRVEKEVVVWAAQYAASTMGRGLVRVGLSTSGSLAGLSWAAARERLELLALAADIAAEPGPRMVERLDPHAFKAAPRAPRSRR